MIKAWPRRSSLIGIFFRGFCMGAADLIPGVSGGTIAFISGIYDRLLTALSCFSRRQTWQQLLRFNFSWLWQHCDGAFLLSLFSGILMAIITLSKLLHYLLIHQTHWLLAFFFGLVLASTVSVYKQLTQVSPLHFAMALVALVITSLIVTLAPVHNEASVVNVFFAGMVAISAMILPGISGSYLLLIFGLYGDIISALHERHWAILFSLAMGCLFGILLFSRLLSYCINRARSAVTMILIGVMIGALPKLWPWKEESDGIKIILQANVPLSEVSNPIDIIGALVLALIGAFCVYLIHHWQSKSNANPK